jgi:hypothetical protein
MASLEYTRRQYNDPNNSGHNSTRYKVTLSDKFNYTKYNMLVFTHENQGTTPGTPIDYISYQAQISADDDPIYLTENPYSFYAHVDDIYISSGLDAEIVYCYALKLDYNYYYVGSADVLSDIFLTITDDTITGTDRWNIVGGSVVINTAGISEISNTEIIDDYSNSRNVGNITNSFYESGLTPNRYYYLKIKDDLNFTSDVYISQSLGTYHKHALIRGTILKNLNTNFDYSFTRIYRGVSSFYVRANTTLSYLTFTHQYKLTSGSTFYSANYSNLFRFCINLLSNATSYTLKSKVEYDTLYGYASETTTQNSSTLATSDMRPVCTVTGNSVSVEVINNGSGNTYSFATLKLDSSFVEGSFTGYSTNDTYTFNSLSSNTYYLALVIVKSSTNVYTYLCEMFHIENTRPATFSWVNGKKMKYANFSLTAAEWISLQTNINQVRVYKGKLAQTVDVVQLGNDITAAKYNSLRTAIQDMPGWGTYIPEVDIGDDITGYLDADNVGNINVIVDELNAIN